MKLIEERIEFFLDEAVCCEVKLNLDDYTEIEKIKSSKFDVVAYKFGNHIFEAKHISDNQWMIKFGTNNGFDALDKESLEMTGEFDIKKTANILENVAKCLINFIKDYNPQQITFDADRPSRVRMYKRLVTLLFKHPDVMDYELAGKVLSGNGHNYFKIIKKGILNGRNSI